MRNVVARNLMLDADSENGLSQPIWLTSLCQLGHVINVIRAATIRPPYCYPNHNASEL